MTIAASTSLLLARQYDLILKTAAGDSIIIYSAYAYEDSGIDEVRFDDGTIWTRDQLVTNAVELPGSLIEGDATDQTLTGTAFDDTFEGGDGNETIIAGAGNDSIFAGDGNDILIGGAGNDLMLGLAGDDTYRFSAGFGQDRIFLSYWNGGDSDVVEFDSTISAADVHLTLQGPDISWGALLTIDGSTDQVYLGSIDSLDEIHFDDGTVWTFDDIMSRVQPWLGVELHGDQAGADILGTSGWDKLSANFGASSTIIGYGGADFISGSDQDDMIDGGAGDDELAGDFGSDTYRFSAGFGEDIIYERLGDGDVNHIVFDATISTGDIIIEREHTGGDFPQDAVILRVAGTEDRITLNGGFNDSDYDIRFADGTVWNSDDIRARWILKTTRICRAIRVVPVVSGHHPHDLRHGQQ